MAARAAGEAGKATKPKRDFDHREHPGKIPGGRPITSRNVALAPEPQHRGWEI
jgi:hypothetical protein